MVDDLCAVGAGGRDGRASKHSLVVEEEAHGVEALVVQPAEVVVQGVLVEPKGRVVKLVLGAVPVTLQHALLVE